MSPVIPDGPSGTLYGVGVGPGDPELLTLKAVRLIERTPVLAVPVKSPGSPSFARDIVAAWITPRHEVLELVFPMRSDADVLRPHWERAAARVLTHIGQGRDVAFLCEGDPFTYGTFVHVFREVREQAPAARIEVIPGVSAYHAAAAATLTPLAAVNDRVAIVPATYGVSVVDDLLTRFDTVVLLKVKPVIDELVDLIERRGLAGHSVFVSRIGTADAEIVRDIGTLKGQIPDYFSLLIVNNPGRVQEEVVKGCRKKASA